MLINNEIGHEDLVAIIYEEQNYWELEESIRMMNSQISDSEKIIWLKKVKKIGVDKVVKWS